MHALNQSEVFSTKNNPTYKFDSKHRVSHEEKVNKKQAAAKLDAKVSLDDDLHTSEGIMSDLTRFVSNSDRLIYIYTLSGIIVATVIITLFRSFYFFSASVFEILSFIFNIIAILSEIYLT